jgi:hypothetical protein
MQQVSIAIAALVFAVASILCLEYAPRVDQVVDHVRAPLTHLIERGQ